MTKLDVVYLTDTGHAVGVVSRAGPAAALPDGSTRVDLLVGEELVLSTSSSTGLEHGEFALRADWLSHVELDLDETTTDVLLGPLGWMAVLPPAGSTAPPKEILRNTRALVSLTWNGTDTFTATFPDGSAGFPPPTIDSPIVFFVSEGTSTRRIEHRYIAGQSAYSVTSVVPPAACLVLAAGGFVASLQLGT
jgi:hypothetical protein